MSSSLKASIGVMDKEKSAGASGGGGGGGASAAGERAGTASSKAYSSHLAVQTDATKYRGKYKELKKKVRQIELVSVNYKQGELNSANSMGFISTGER